MTTHLFEHLASYVLSMRAGAVRTATKFLLPDMTVRISQDRSGVLPSGKPRKARRVRVTVSVGRPNFAERKFIADCKKAGEKFPVRKIQFTPFPKRRVTK